MKTTGAKLYLGTSGLLLPVPNKLHYPKDFQDKSRLQFYGSLLNSIEINSSFYKIPQAKTVSKWAKEVPNDFRFSFKVFKEISHSKQLAFNEETIHHFMTTVNSVGDKKGSLLLQFPPSVNLNYLLQIGQILTCFRKHDVANLWHFAVEFRHASLYVEEAYELLASKGMGMVIHDKAKAASPIIDLNDNFVYLRFHGPNGDYRGTYHYDVLAEYATIIAEWLAMQKTVYVYFNNTMGEVFSNIDQLEKLIA